MNNRKNDSGFKKTTLKPFYGWYIVGIGFLSIFVGVGATIDALAVFVKPMSESLGWTRTSIMGAYTVGAVASALVSPIVGRFIDKYGARVLMPVSALIGGGLLIAVSRVNSVWQFYLFFGIGLGIARPCFSMVSAMTTVSNWFIVKRGRALAITTMGAGISALVVIPFTQYFVTNMSWRTAWVVLGLMTFTLLALPSAIIIRRRPEDMGLLPDGGSINRIIRKNVPGVDERKTEEPTEIEVNWTAREAMRTRAFWFLLVSQILTTFAFMGIWLNAIASFTDQGISPAHAALAVGSISITSIPSRVVWGLIAEKFDLRFCSIASFIGLAASILIIMVADTIFIALVGILLNGLFFGGVIVLQTVVWPEYYGRFALGAIQGYTELFRVIGFAGGPLLAGIMYDKTGSYYVAFTAFALSCIIATLFMFFAKPPIKPNPAYPCAHG